VATAATVLLTRSGENGKQVTDPSNVPFGFALPILFSKLSDLGFGLTFDKREQLGLDLVLMCGAQVV
jgi:hypothetical protein